MHWKDEPSKRPFEIGAFCNRQRVLWTIEREDLSVDASIVNIRVGDKPDVSYRTKRKWKHAEHGPTAARHPGLKSDSHARCLESIDSATVSSR